MDNHGIVAKFNALIEQYGSAEKALQFLDPAMAALLAHHSPFTKLVVYGSLAPGQSNAGQLADVKGAWQQVIIRGLLENAGWADGEGYPGFRFPHSGSENEISAQLFTSHELPAHWHRLDEFEGEEYRRVLIVYQAKEDEGIGFIYALA